MAIAFEWNARAAKCPQQMRSGWSIWSGHLAKLYITLYSNKYIYTIRWCIGAFVALINCSSHLAHRWKTVTVFFANIVHRQHEASMQSHERGIIRSVEQTSLITTHKNSLKVYVGNDTAYTLFSINSNLHACCQRQYIYIIHFIRSSSMYVWEKWWWITLLYFHIRSRTSISQNNIGWLALPKQHRLTDPAQGPVGYKVIT